MNDEYLRMFVDETREHLQSWSDGMLRLEQGIDDATVAEVFRAAHTIKGMAMTMGFEKMGQLTHRAENVLDQVRNHVLTPSTEVVDSLLGALDALETLLNGVEDEGQEPDVDVQALLVQLEASSAGASHTPGGTEVAATSTTEKKRSPANKKLKKTSKGSQVGLDVENIRAVALDALTDGYRVMEIAVAIDKNCSMPQARAVQLIQRLEPNQVLLTLPELTSIESAPPENLLMLVGAVEDSEVLADKVSHVSEVTLRSIREWSEAELTSLDEDAILPVEQVTRDEHVVHVIQAALRDTSLRVYEVGIRLRTGALLKSARMFMVFEAVGGQDRLLYTDPPVAEIEDERFGNDVRFISWSKDDIQSMRTAVESVSDVDLVQLREWSRAPSGAARPGTNVAQAAAQTGQPKQRPVASVRVDVDKLEALMTLFSEIAIDRTRLSSLSEELGDERLAQTVSHMSRATSDLQELIMSIRMTPLENVFQRFPRMVRDTAKQLEKQIAFEIAGGDTELDRVVVEEIGDPIMHLLRNSLSHGLEDAADRRKAGKEDQGHIWLRAYSSGNRVFIEVEDDGRGIQREKVLDKARKQGLVRDNAVWTDQQVFDLLFASGFSTADEVSDLSGRGVGLDVVKAKIEALSGQVYVESEVGRGTKFTIALPVTLALLRSILVRVDGQPYAIPMQSVEEILTVQQTREVSGEEVMVWRDKVTPVVRARAMFGMPPMDGGLALCLSRGKQRVALVVDEVMGQDEVVVKSLPREVRHVRFFSGATILGDGQVSLIVEPSSLFGGVSG